MKFAHLADCHVGSWRDPRLGWISTEAFTKAIDISVERGADFILICGDLFNTSMPGIDKLKIVAKKLRELRDRNIPVYLIAGSHDYSASGKTMIDVLENADLLVNVTRGEVIGEKLRLKFTVDKKTGAKLTGILGRRNMLDRSYYESLDRESLQEEPGFKIFLFHTALNEFKPKSQENVDTAPLSMLPAGFDYYAGGHVHTVMNELAKGYGRIVYPGPLFPNSFQELEELHSGGFWFYEDGKLDFVRIKIFDTVHIKLDCTRKTPQSIREELLAMLGDLDVAHKIVTIRLFGNIAGRISDIDFREIISAMYERKAYFVMKNTAKLESESFEEVKVTAASVEEIEDAIVQEHMGQVKLNGIDTQSEKTLVKGLMESLLAEKGEGERVQDFEQRVKDDAEKILSL